MYFTPVHVHFGSVILALNSCEQDSNMKGGDNMEEMWKDFYNYQVSNYGQVRNSKTGRLLKLQLNEKGYLRVALRIDGKTKWYRVSRLVASLFIPNPDNLPEVNHKDENKLNNRADNLEWCNRIYNVHYGTGLERIMNKIMEKQGYHLL